jgi:hypothetical protein
MADRNEWIMLVANDSQNRDPNDHPREGWPRERRFSVGVLLGTLMQLFILPHTSALVMSSSLLAWMKDWLELPKLKPLIPDQYGSLLGVCLHCGIHRMRFF